MEYTTFRNIEGDKYINLDLSTHFGIVGITEDNDAYTKIKQSSLINPSIDAEYSRFKYNGLDGKLLTPNFRGINGLFSNDITYALFTLDEINNQQTTFTNSFFILEYFDSIDSNNQTLLSTNYVKPMLKSGKTFDIIYEPNTYKITSMNTFLSYSTKIGVWNGFNNVSIPNNYLHLTEIYLKLSFFNSKIGGRTFFHVNNTNLENPVNEDFYVRLLLNSSSMVYNFEQQNRVLNLFEFKNVKFIDKERQNNKPNASNTTGKSLILGSGDVI